MTFASQQPDALTPCRLPFWPSATQFVYCVLALIGTFVLYRVSLSEMTHHVAAKSPEGVRAETVRRPRPAWRRKQLGSSQQATKIPELFPHFCISPRF